MFLSRRLRTFAVAAAIGGLLLNAVTPLLASAAAAIRGVPTGEICDVYGVRMPAHDVAASAHEMPGGTDMSDSAHAMHDGAMDHDGGEVAPPAPPHHHDDSSALHHGDHCALTALATFALPVDARTTAIVPPVHVDGISLRVTRAAIFDAAAHWTIRQKRGPPTIA
jgi:hypothetical protein